MQRIGGLLMPVLGGKALVALPHAIVGDERIDLVRGQRR